MNRFGALSLQLTLLSLTLLGLLVHPGATSAQDDAHIQVFAGRIDPGSARFYTLPDVTEGDVLYVYAAGTSGNLDPFIALLDESVNAQSLEAAFLAEVERAIAAGEDPFLVIPRLGESFFVAWDDDSGEGRNAAFSYTVPEDGDYQLLLTSSPGQGTFGDFELTLGINAPEVLAGEATPTGDTIALLDEEASEVDVAVQEVAGQLTEAKRSTFFELAPLAAGDTLQVHVTATDGDLRPIIYLEDFGGKPLSAANVSGNEDEASLTYAFTGPAEDFRIQVESCCEVGTATAGTFRLLVGVNEPAVLSGEAEPQGRRVVRAPIPVAIGVRLQQITGVDQRAENYGAVATMLMEWTDPELAFRPDDCGCRFKVYTDTNFNQFLATVSDRWPAFTIYNQQGNRWIQNRAAVLFPDGRASYLERFSTTLQAPDFDFRLFPFDTQQFFIRVDSLYPEEDYVFTDLEGYTDVGPQLGEEEWILTDFGTTISSEIVNTRNITSRFSFGFEANRHLNFYIFRILLPIVVIVLISWITFFLKSYDKRVDVASANLLLFIAFNFTISSDLPRLGYLTLLDTILISTFVITALVIIFNVILKRLEAGGRSETAERIDRYTIWLYPLSYIVAFIVVGAFFS